MSASAATRLQRVLDLEERQNWRNRAVIGGLQAMAARWADDARSEGMEPHHVAALTALMQAYGTATPAERPAIVADLRRLLVSPPPPPVARPSEPAADAAPAAEEGKAEAGPPATAALPDETGTDKAFTDKAFTAEAFTAEEALLEIPLGEPEEAAVEEPAAAAVTQPERAPSFDGRPGLGRVWESSDDDLVFADLQQAAPPPERAPSHNIKRNARDLQSNVTLLPGVGEATAEQLARLGIQKVADLLWHLPARYDDFSQMRTISRLAPGEQATIVANVWDVRERKISMNRSIVEAILGDSTGTLHAVWFNKWIIKQLRTGATLRFSGKVDLFRGQKSLENPAFEEVDKDRIGTGRLSPVYPLTEGITNNRLRNLIHDVLDGYARFLTDPLPAAIRQTYALPELGAALRQVHFPDSREQLAAAQQRLAFEELFYLQLGVLQRRNLLRQAAAPALSISPEALAQFTGVLPFGHSGAQERVIDEIRRDLQRSVPMTRLVQGDVGSGKTAVAAAAMWAAAGNGLQSALLAPTQILAEQHHRGISRLLEQLTQPDGAPLRVALLTGRVTGEARDQVMADMASGAVDVVVGTTALIQDGVEFANLGLIVVDEQHRFGVEQRGILRSRAEGQPHLLVMSATPIPRSLSLTLYGDLDVSRLDEMPPGRQIIQTKLFAPRERERLYDFIRSAAAAGRQAYIVYPLVEESETLDAGAATVEFDRLQQNVFADLRLGLLHGRLTGAQKDETMRAFAAGDIQVLVSTTVIEVGIDVPNASIILIEDADRFGLAQLHQLRGRVGRGEHKSYCALVSRADSATVRERLQFVADHNDGFALAEKDLELRGPGDFLGTRQSGLPELHIAQLSDMQTLLRAREAAQTLISQDPQLADYPQITRQVERFWRGQGDIN